MNVFEFFALQSSAPEVPPDRVALYAGTSGDFFTKNTAGTVKQLANLLKVKVGNFTRVMSVATGNVSYTGVGFTPRALLLFSSLQNGSVANTSVGFTDGTSNWCLLSYSTTGANFLTTILTDKCVYAFDDAATLKVNHATLASFDADGFTLSWTKSSTPTSTMNLGYLALA